MSFENLLSYFLTILFSFNSTVSADTNHETYENTSILAKKMRSFATLSDVATYIKKDPLRMVLN